jgi:hypothetical protein
MKRIMRMRRGMFEGRLKAGMVWGWSNRLDRAKKRIRL